MIKCDFPWYNRHSGWSERDLAAAFEPENFLQKHTVTKWVIFPERP